MTLSTWSSNKGGGRVRVLLVLVHRDKTSEADKVQNGLSRGGDHEHVVTPSLIDLVL